MKTEEENSCGNTYSRTHPRPACRTCDTMLEQHKHIVKK